MSDAFDGALFAELARGLALGRPLTLTERTGSTNDDALAAARAGAPHGALFVTEEQERGRGRRGNAWLAPARQGLLFSVVLRPKVAAPAAPALALLAGLAVREAVAERFIRASVGAEPRVKWPNDVVVGDKKIAGVLVESQVRGGLLGGVVVGVGLNAGRVELPPDVAKSATSLAHHGVDVRRETLLAAILGAVDARLAAIESPEEPLKSLVSELNAQDALRGKKVAIGDLRGVGAGIDEHGRLLVVDDSGGAHALTSGHVAFWE